jgi:hypothetical protein
MQPRLVLDPFLGCGPVLENCLSLRNQPRDRESERCVGSERLLHGRKPGVLTKGPTAPVDFLRSGYFELADLLRRRDIDAALRSESRCSGRYRAGRT